MSKILTEKEVLQRLRNMVRYEVKIKDLAVKFNVSAAFMSMVLSGKKPITEPMLKHLCVEKIITFRQTQ